MVDNIDKKRKEHGYYEVYLAVFDEREDKANGPYNVSVDILAHEDELAEVQQNMPKILAEINSKEGEEYTKDSEYIQNHFHSLCRRDLVFDILVGIPDIDDSVEGFRQALKDEKLKFVQ